MGCSMPDLLSSTISQSLLKFTSIESVMLSNPPHPLLLSSPCAFNLSRHQGFFQWVSSSHQVAKVLELQLWPQSFQWIFRVEVPSRFIFWKVVDLSKNFSDILIGGFGNAYGFHSRRSLARKWWNWTNHRSDLYPGLLEKSWQWDPGHSHTPVIRRHLVATKWDRGADGDGPTGWLEKSELSI